MCPTVAKLRCDISAHGLHSLLQTAITFPFQIQIEHRLKLWTHDFPRFPTRYCMNNLNFGNHFAAVSQLRNEGHCAAKWHSCAKIGFAAAKYPAEWGFWCEITLFHFAMRFAAAKWMLLYCEVALVCQDWFRSCQIPCGMELSLRNGGFHALVVRSRFRSCEIGTPVLRSGTRVPNLVSQLRNALAETSTVLRNGLATKCRFRRGCEISQTPVFPLFLPCFRSV
uniref:Uncharacterized protein n=1 Tax=Vitis vinifera TaxID=29760 RepID=A5C3W3_VITVI|nr:hypothetical protein VITISV_010853 [Vitis vinifera]